MMDRQVPLVQDTWGLDKVDGFTLEAYKALHDQGVIELQYPVRFFADRVEMDYLAACTPECAWEALRQEAERLALAHAMEAAFPEAMGKPHWAEDAMEGQTVSPRHYQQIAER